MAADNLPAGAEPVQSTASVTTEPVATHSSPAQPTDVAEGTQPEARRPVFAEGTSPQPKLEPEAPTRGSRSRLDAPARGSSTSIAGEPSAPRVPAELAARATTIGEVWSQECVRELRAQQREIVGGWPGTLREARRRVLAAMPRDLDPLHLEELAKIANLAARRGWEQVSEPDLEP